MRVKYSLGVSLDEGLLRLVYLRGAWRGRRVVDTLCLHLPSSQDQEGPFSQEVQKFLLRNGVGPFDEITFGIPRSAVLFRRLTTPPVKEKVLPDLVGFECERHLPGKKEEFVVGYQYLDRTEEGGHRLVLGAVKRGSLQGQLSVLHKANLTPVSLQPVTMGVAAAFRQADPESAPALLVAVGRSSITADYVAGGKVLESWHFGAMKQGGEREDSPVPAEALCEKLSHPLFLDKLPGGQLPPLRLYGHGVDEVDFRMAIRERLQVEAEVFSPLEHFGGKGDPRGEMAAPLGLALLGLSGGRGGLELSEERVEGVERRPQYRSTVILALVLLALLGGTFAVRNVHHSKWINQIDEEVARLKDKKRAVEELNRAVGKKRDRLAFLSAAVLHRTRQADLFRELTSLIPEDSYLVDYVFRGGKIEISGLAPSASLLIPILEASPLFKEVEFSSAIVSQGKTHERFKIRLLLEENIGQEDKS